ncbi:MAG: glycoside hydrolase family 15 protein [Deltaproteobacteria bacterium]|nr:MAG: glycoside hydrolase family 15 protein [Deltaproteobacteria bacterium]
MPRDIPVGNGKLLICFDSHYNIRDLYFPHVGQENHVQGEYCRLGLWIDNQFSWVGEDWKIDLGYEEDTLVTRVSLYNNNLAVLLNCRDVVDFHENIYVREIIVENMAPEARQVRLFLSHNLDISGNSVGDTAAYDPHTGGLVHYKGSRYFLIGGNTEDTSGLDQFAVGQKNINGKEGTYIDAEDGSLSGNTIAQGSVDSVIGLHLDIPGLSQKKAFYWLAAGENWNDVRRLNDRVKHKKPETLIKRTSDYWHLWVHKETLSLETLPQSVAKLYRRSLLVLNTQIDANGGILAANDSDVVMFNRDTYSYIWPRDGALVANALDVAGYPEIAQRFYEFAARTISKDGYFLHKYNPDGTLASSWHPWQENGQHQLPIQEDETALVIWALWNHFVIYRDIEFIKPFYRPLIKNAAEFMCSYRDKETGLPDASYDLWEERRGMLSFTTGSVFGGLTAASLFCTVFGEDDLADHYQQVASEIRDAASKHLWRPELKRFCRMISRDDKGNLVYDDTCDASLWGLFAFGLYDADDDRITATINSLREKLWLKTEVGGLARYEDDYYHQIDKRFPGNPWFICTLWLADHLAGIATNERELDEPLKILEWVTEHALPSGVLAEQVHPVTGKPLSVSPLTWSHATFVASTRRIMRKMSRIHRCPECDHSKDEIIPGDDWLAKLYTKACDAIHGICSVK